MMKSTKGITLVALVVTIIILLILAGVSIAALTNTELFEKAMKAERESKNAQELENTIFEDYENSINEIVATGSREENSDKNTYSLEEKQIGTWIDGKKIYRKTITGSTLPANGSTLITNVDSVVNAYGEQLYQNTIWYHFPILTANEDIRWELYNTDNTIRACIASYIYNNVSAYKWTFEYTKVTDK